MTVNETSGYRWPDFRKRCEAAVKSIFEAHPSPKDFKIKEIILRYINAVEFDYSKENIFDFMHEKMRTTISLPDTLFTEDFTAKSNPSNFSWQSTFQKKNPAGSVVLRFSTGKREGVPSLIWETRIISAGDQFPGIDTKIIEWLESAHDVAYDWFFKLIEGELERRFS
jgi:uncharacterized protein (TIGR04255 family)